MQKLELEDVKDLVGKILEKAFPGDFKKHKIYSYNGRLTMSCPYCGDSDDIRKKRGNLYTESLSFKCYNGGCGVFKDFINLLDDHGLKNMLSIDQIEEVKNLIVTNKSNRRVSAKIDVFLLENYRDVLIPREYYKSKLNLIDLPAPLQKYLTDRNQIPDEKYLYSPYKKSIHILNLTSDGKYILGLQLRNMNKNAVNKYFTYKISGIYKKLLKITKPEIITKAEELDGISVIFGFCSVNLDKEVTIFEGPFDSFIFPNSVGICSVNNKFPFDIDNKRWFFDSDVAGRDELRKKLSEGQTVFLWKKFLDESPLPEREKWDLNDIVDYLRSNKVKLNKKFDEYFSNDIWNMIYI